MDQPYEKATKNKEKHFSTGPQLVDAAEGDVNQKGQNVDIGDDLKKRHHRLMRRFVRERQLMKQDDRGRPDYTDTIFGKRYMDSKFATEFIKTTEDYERQRKLLEYVRQRYDRQADIADRQHLFEIFPEYVSMQDRELSQRMETYIMYRNLLFLPPSNLDELVFLFMISRDGLNYPPPSEDWDLPQEWNAEQRGKGKKFADGVSTGDGRNYRTLLQHNLLELWGLDLNEAYTIFKNFVDPNFRTRENTANPEMPDEGPKHLGGDGRKEVQSAVKPSNQHPQVVAPQERRGQGAGQAIEVVEPLEEEDIF